MCGIIGYVGPRDAAPILLGGLARLEYRGYDSAGIATLSTGRRMEIRRAVGKLENLKKLLGEVPLAGQIGIGHTRWATHGRPSETNAHPHQAGPVAVIHNGIIENYVELRATLLKRGHKLKSETDSELISHLIEERLRAIPSLVEAVRSVIQELRGSFSLVVLSETAPGTLVAAKTATPLVLGLGDGENFVASDIPAILEHTRRAIVLEDGEMAELNADSITLMTFAGDPIERQPRTIEWDAVAATKAGYAHYLRKEIAEQPQAWIDTLSGRVSAGASDQRFESVRFESELLPASGAETIRRIVMVSAGASWISSQIGKFMIEELCGIPAEVDYSAEFRYRNPAIDAHTLMIAVSQSGETADTLAAVEEGKRRGSHLLALTNTVDSSIARKAHASVVHAMRSRDQRHYHQVFPDPNRGVLSLRDPSGAAPRAARRVASGRVTAPALRDTEADRSDYRAGAENREDRAEIRQGARLPLSRTRNQLSGRARGRSQAQGDFLYPRRRLFSRRDEARADCPYR